MRVLWGFSVGLLVASTYHLIATTTPSQVVENAVAWLRFLGGA